MIEKLCNFLTNKIRKENSDIDDERAEVINYGLQLVIGEIPKTIIMLLIAYFLGVLKLSIIALLCTLPYRTFSGGVHLKTHIGCIIATSLFYAGNAYISKIIVFEPAYLKYLIALIIGIFSTMMIALYAPADTEAVPILRKKDRIMKRNLSYVTMIITLIVGVIVKDTTISNILIIGTLIQTISITRFMYKITNNRYGYEVYCENEATSNIS